MVFAAVFESVVVVVVVIVTVDDVVLDDDAVIVVIVVDVVDDVVVDVVGVEQSQSENRTMTWQKKNSSADKFWFRFRPKETFFIGTEVDIFISVISCNVAVFSSYDVSLNLK